MKMGTQKKRKARIGVVTAQFNKDVTERLEKGAIAALKTAGLPKEQVTIVRVPGAFEIPLAIKFLFEAGCEGVVALGAVIRGDTAHFDYVCRSVERGCSHLQLEYGRPVGFGVLTTDNEDQALERCGGRHGNKGAEAVQAVLEMLDIKHCVLYRKEDK